MGMGAAMTGEVRSSMKTARIRISISFGKRLPKEIDMRILAVFMLLLTSPVIAAPIPMTAQQDHQAMMDQLRIASLRQGANGNNRQAPNAANYDESKVNRFT